MKLTVVIPCYNEANTIEAVIRRVNEAPVVQKEIIVVDDGSTDGTREMLEGFLASQVDKVIYHDGNKGKGSALRSAFAATTGDLVIVQDADLEYSPLEYPKLIQPIVDGEADVVYGSRFSAGKTHRNLFSWHYLGNRFLTALSNMLTHLELTDMETCYKVFRRSILEKIEIEEPRFGVEPEITAKVAKLNCRIYEVGISYDGRTLKQGKKIGWKDGLSAIWCILKYNL
jgi:glycosyltransferase involved in cell wall biosynthesis